MSSERSFGVTEAQFGLSLLTCLLLALGYVTLQRLGGAGNPPIIEKRPDQTASPHETADASRVVEPEQPHVLVTRGADEPNGASPYTTRRPSYQESSAGGLNDRVAEQGAVEPGVGQDIVTPWAPFPEPIRTSGREEISSGGGRY